MKSAHSKAAADDFLAPARRAFQSVARQLRAESAPAATVRKVKVSRVRSASEKLARSSAR
jgi:hypothetical protein